MWFMFSDFIFQGALKFWRKLEDRVLKDGFRFCFLWSEYSNSQWTNLGIFEDCFQSYHQHHIVESFRGHIVVKLRLVFKSTLFKPIGWLHGFNFEIEPELAFLLHVVFHCFVLVLAIDMPNMMMVTFQVRLPKNSVWSAISTISTTSRDYLRGF